MSFECFSPLSGDAAFHAKRKMSWFEREDESRARHQPNEQVQRPAQPVRCNALLGAGVLFEVPAFAMDRGFERTNEMHKGEGAGIPLTTLA